MAGNPIDENGVRRIFSSMLNEHVQRQGQQRQLFQREPMRRRAEDPPTRRGNTKVEERNAKQLREAKAQEAKLEEQRQMRSKKYLDHEEASLKRQLKLERERAKLQKAYDKNDNKAFKRADERIKKLEKAEKAAARNHQKYQKLDAQNERKLFENREKMMKSQRFLEERARRRNFSDTVRARRAAAHGALQNVGGPVGPIARGVNAYKNAKMMPGGGGGMAAALHAAGSGGTGTISNMLSSAGTGAQLGSVFGPWGTAIGGALGAAYEGGKKLIGVSTEISDKILKLSGNYIKATNAIPDNAEDAAKRLVEVGERYKDAYADALRANARFGASIDETYDNLMRLSRAIRPIGKDAQKTLTQMSKDTFAFSAALDVPVETIEGAMTNSMLGLGRTAEQTSKDLGSMYSTLTAANNAFSKELGNTRLRMDAFSDTMFEAARNGDLWTFDYKEVGKQLAYIGVAATKAGLSQERLQRLMKLQSAILTDTSDQFIVHEQGRKELAEAQRLTAGKTEKEQEAILTKRYGTAEIAKAAMRTLREVEKQGGVAGGMQNIEFGQLTAGTETGSKARLDSLRQQLASVSEQGGGRTALVAQKYGLENNLPLARELSELLMKSANLTGDEFARRLEAGRKKQTPEEQAGKPGGAAIVEASARGANQSIENMKDAGKEFVAVTALASAGLWGLVEALQVVDKFFKGGQKTVTEQKIEVKERLAAQQTPFSPMSSAPIVQEAQLEQMKKDNPQLTASDFKKMLDQNNRDRSEKAAEILERKKNQHDYMAKSDLRAELGLTPQQIKDVLAARKETASSLSPDEIYEIITKAAEKDAAHLAEMKKSWAKSEEAQPEMPKPEEMPKPQTAKDLTESSGQLQSIQSQAAPMTVSPNYSSAELVKAEHDLDSGGTEMLIKLKGKMTLKGQEKLGGQMAVEQEQYRPSMDR